MLRSQVDAVLAYDPAVRLGGDAEDLHQLRVATRRLRAILRAAKPLLVEEWADALRAELGRLGDVLGPVRDLDVLLEHLEAEAALLDPAERRAFAGALTELRRERDEARDVTLAALRSPGYLELLDRLDRAADSPLVRNPDVPLGEIAAGAFRELRRAVSRLGSTPTDAELHRVRILGKRARYAAELAQGSAGRPVGGFLRAAKAFQDVVGEHQDAVVAEERLRGLVTRRRSAAFAFAAGRIVERQRARRAAARAAFPRAWRSLKKSGLKAWS